MILTDTVRRRRFLLALLLVLAAVDLIYYVIAWPTFGQYRMEHFSFHPLFYFVSLWVRPTLFLVFGCLLTDGLFPTIGGSLRHFLQSFTLLWLLAWAFLAVYTMTRHGSRMAFAPAETALTLLLDYPALFLLPGALLGVGRGEAPPSAETQAGL